MNTGYMKPEPNMKIEDEEDLLYGESGNAFKVTSVSWIFCSVEFMCRFNYSNNFRLSIWLFH